MLNMKSFANAQLMVSDTQLFVIGTDSSSPINLLMYFVNFGSTSPTWSNTILCPSTSWQETISDAAVSSDGSLIYSFFGYGTTTVYGHFMAFNVSNGHVSGSRYISNISPSYIWDIKVSGSYVVVSFKSGTITRFLVYNSSTSTFTNRDGSSLLNLLSLEIDPNSNR